MSSAGDISVFINAICDLCGVGICYYDLSEFFNYDRLGVRNNRGHYCAFCELTRTLRKFAPGDTTTVTVFRGGKELVLTITLDEKPDDTAKPNIPTIPPEDTTVPSEESEWDKWYEYLKPFFDGSKGQTYDEWFEQFKDYFGK